MNDIVFVHDVQASHAGRKSALERAGWRVRATHEAREALAWVRESPPALVLLDVLVEGGPGFDLCQRIRAHASAANLPVVLGCHVYQEAEHADLALQCGAQRYLSLPIAAEELVAVVTAVCGSRGEVRAA
jgi:DNA-binding response OmpR family regulator